MNSLLIRDNKSIWIRNIAVFLIIGNLLYFYFSFPPIYWRVSFVLLALATFFSKDNRPSLFEKVILCFIGFNLLHFIISFIWINPTTTNLGNTLFCLSAFLLFPYLGRKKVLNSGFLLLTIILLTISGVAHFYNAQEIAATRYLEFDIDSYTNNASVVFLFLLPSLFYIKNNVLRYIILTVCLFFLVSSVKRGNILASIIPVLLIVWFSLKDTKGSIWKTIFIFASIAFIYYYVREWILNNEYFISRYEQTLEGYSSNRDIIYFEAWSLWYNSGDFIKMLFGYGYDGTINNMITGYRAHNDWLELLVDYGLLGVGFYLYIFVLLFGQIKHTFNRSRLVLVASLIIWFMKSCYSMGFTDEFLALLSLPVGCAISDTIVDDETSSIYR